MAIVKEVIEGNFKGYIHDDCIVKTQKERDEILDAVAEVYLKHYIKQAKKAAETGSA